MAPYLQDQNEVPYENGSTIESIDNEQIGTFATMEIRALGNGDTRNDRIFLDVTLRKGTESWQKLKQLSNF